MSYLDSQGYVSPNLLLHRIEMELGNCRVILAKVEMAVETLLQSEEVAADDPLHIVEMQSIDLLDQILADLMLCLQDLARSDSITTAHAIRLGAILRRTRLAGLRNRLAGSAETEVDIGDGVELF